MSIISEVKCARCDRKYSGVRSRCPYCGARRIGSGKYSEDGDNSRGKMLIGVLIMVVLVIAAGVLLFTSNPQEEEISNGSSVTDDETPIIPNDDETISVTGENPASPASPDEPQTTEEESPSPPPPRVQSLELTYANAPAVDFTEPVAAQIPIKAKVEPPGVEFSEEIIWESTDETVFQVVPSLDGMSATVTIIGSGSARNATLIVSIGDIKAECIVRVKAS